MIAAALVILFSLATVVIAHAEPYVPLTPAQAAAWIQLAGPDAVVQDIIKLDWIEHTPFVVHMPDMTPVLKGRELVVGWQGTALVSVPDPTGKSYLEAMVTLQEAKFPGFVPVAGTQWWVWPVIILAGAGGLLLGLAAH